MSAATEGAVSFDVSKGTDHRGGRVAVVRRVLTWVCSGEVAVFRGETAEADATKFAVEKNAEAAR